MVLATARSWHADLIVLRSHGRTGLMRWILGSVAHKIALHRPVPVLLLRAQGHGLSVQGERPIRILVGLGWFTAGGDGAGPCCCPQRSPLSTRPRRAFAGACVAPVPDL